MSQPYRLGLFGGFRLTSAGGDPIIIPRRKAAALIAYLGATIGSANTRNKLASLLWGQSEQRLARQSLRQILSTFSHDIAAGSARILRLDGQMVSLDPKYIQVDAPKFESLIIKDDEESLTKAIELYKGEFLAGMSANAPDFEEWLDQSRSRFRDLAMHGLVHLAERQQGAGNLDMATISAQQALRIDPYREDIHRHLMRMYANRGMRAAALSQFRECESILWRELRVSPDDETVSLHDQIISGSEFPRDAKPNDSTSASATIAVKRNDEPVLVGFTQELAVLKKHFRDASQSGTRLVLVAGEAGSGKTALLQKFGRYLDRDNISAVTVRANRTQQSMNYGIWKGFLNTQKPQTQGVNDLSSLLIRRLAFFRGSSGTMAKPRHNEGDQPWQAFEAMVELLRTRGDHAGLAVLVENVHFADEASLQLLSYAVRNLRKSPVLFVATVRPEILNKQRELDAIIRDIDREKLLHNVAVPALSRSQMETLVRRIRQENHVAIMPRARLREIWLLSDGNPGIVMEAALAGRENTDGKPADVPEALRVDLAARLDGLDDTAKLLSATASVIGEKVDQALLVRAAGADEETALNGIEALIDAGILASEDEKLFFTRGRFHYAQYRMLLPARRRHLHRMVAQAIADGPIVNPVVYFSALAHHFNAAGQINDALGNGVRLAQMQMRQGTYALAKQSFQRVLQALSAGEKKTADIQHAAEARIGLVVIEEIAGNFEQGLSHLKNQEMNHAEHLGMPLRARYLTALGRLNGALGKVEVGRSLFRHATGKGHADEDHIWMPCDRILEFIHVLGGSFRASIDRMAIARETAHRRGLIADEAAMSATICILHAVDGSADKAMTEAQTAVNRATRLGNSRLLAAGLHVKGVAQTWCGDKSSAISTFDEALNLAVMSGDLGRQYTVHGYRGRAHAVVGHIDEAGADFETALNMGAELNIGFSRPLFEAWKAESLAEAGEGDLGLSVARTALKLATAANRPWAYSVGLRALACVLAHSGTRDFAGAERAIRMALAEQSTLGLKFERARSLVAYARILRAAGERERSARLIRQTQKLLRQMKTVVNREAVQSLKNTLCRPCSVSSKHAPESGSR